jgi:hypothetical protein
MAQRDAGRGGGVVQWCFFRCPWEGGGAFNREGALCWTTCGHAASGEREGRRTAAGPGVPRMQATPWPMLRAGDVRLSPGASWLAGGVVEGLHIARLVAASCDACSAW